MAQSKVFTFAYRLIMAVLFPMLLLALVLFLTGFRGPIQLDNTYYNFMQQAAIRADSWGVEIPSIPLLETDNTDGLDFFEALAEFVNFFIRITNVAISVINMIISLFVTIGAIISLLFDFAKSTTSSSSNSGGLSYWNNVVHLV